MLEPLNQVGPYKILAKLGAGGMGVVYKAEDQRLHRTVALKMIDESGDQDNLKKRFLREARAAASIDHPNICRVYDVGETNGQPYLVMEMLEGESLAARLARGPLPPVEAVEVTLGVLSALAALHRCAMMHRDLKPSNVFLSTQGIKLLDFGLAKPIASALEENITETEISQPGMLVGTPRYASPEHLAGKPLDARSDLFSAAALLFEMLAGRPAFSGVSALEVFHAILYDSPPALTGSAAISAIDRVVHRALAKDPEMRFSRAEEMAAELRAAIRLEHTGPVVEARTMKRLIILPFKPLRADPDTDFLAFSLPDAIGASLAGLSSLVVRSTLAAARFAGPTLDLKEIAREADVDVVLTGTLLRAGTQLRLATQLVEAPAGTLIWSRSLQVELRDIFQLQDTLVSSVVESLALPLTVGERRLLTHDAPASASAYDLYLRANDWSRKADLPGAIDLYQKCIQIDPGYAPAWAHLGRALWLLDKYTTGSKEKQAEADRALQRALELNPDLPMAHNFYTMMQVELGHATEAMVGLLRRGRRHGNDPAVFAGLTHACRYCGLFGASFAAHRIARRLDPQVVTTVTQTYFLSGDYQMALETSAGLFGYFAAACKAMQGSVGEAVEMLRKSELEAPWLLARLHVTSLRAALEGKPEESARAADQLLGIGFTDPEGWYYLSRPLAYAGEEGRALQALKRCVEEGCFCLPALPIDPWLARLRGHSAFERILDAARSRHEAAESAFQFEGGRQLLGM